MRPANAIAILAAAPLAWLSYVGARRAINDDLPPLQPDFQPAFGVEPAVDVRGAAEQEQPPLRLAGSWSGLCVADSSTWLDLHVTLLLHGSKYRLHGVLTLVTGEW